METATADQQTNNAPITYPERIYDGKNFVPNLNREQSSDNLTTVLTDKNEVLGFPDHTSQQEMEAAINADKNGSISTYKPSFYDKFIRQPLENMGMASFQPPFITDIKPSPERAFATSMAEAATAGVFKPEFTDQEAKANPIPAFAGGLVGSIAAFATGGALLDGFKLSQLTPFAENIIKGGILGGAYKGVSETSNELRDSDHPDLAKIGEGVLHDGLWWGGISGLAGAASKPVGMAASAGLGYLMAKSDGADEPSALLNGAVLGGFHLLQSHGDQEDVRKFVTDKIQNNVADYILAKSPMVHEEVAKQAGREFVANHAEDAIEQTNNGLTETGIETPQAKEIEEKQKIQRPEKPIEDGYDSNLLNYLSQYIPVDRLVRLSGTDRVALGKASESDLESYKQQYEQMAQIITSEKSEASKPITPEVDRMINEGGKVDPLEEAIKSKTIMNQVMKNVTNQVMLKDGEESTNQDASQEGAETEEIANNSAPNTNTVQAQDESHALPSSKTSIETSKLEEAPANVPEESSSTESIPSETEKGKKTSGLAKSVEDDAVYKGLVDDLGDLPSYKSRDMAEIAKKVSDFIDKDPELAKKIALGEAPEQDDLRAQELFTGLKAKAFKEGDIPLIHELGTSEKASAMATELGQRVKALDSKEENNPIQIVKDVQKARSGSDVIKQQKDIVKHLKDEMKKPKLKQNDWDSFIESIKC